MPTLQLYQPAIHKAYWSSLIKTPNMSDLTGSTGGTHRRCQQLGKLYRWRHMLVRAKYNSEKLYLWLYLTCIIIKIIHVRVPKFSLFGIHVTLRLTPCTNGYTYKARHWPLTYKLHTAGPRPGCRLTGVMEKFYLPPYSASKMVASIGSAICN